MSKVVTMDQAVAMIQPNDTVITSGFLTAGTPAVSYTHLTLPTTSRV